MNWNKGRVNQRKANGLSEGSEAKAGFLEENEGLSEAEKDLSGLKEGPGEGLRKVREKFCLKERRDYMNQDRFDWCDGNFQ
jgi:hypothetical protein